METIEDVLRWPVKYWCACQAQQDWVPEHPELVQCEDPRNSEKPALPQGPKDRVVSRFVASENERPFGQPLHEGSVLHLMNGDKVLQVTLAVHLNGFRIMPLKPPVSGNGEDFAEAPEPLVSRSFSPFSSIDRSMMSDLSSGSTPSCAAFKLTVVRADGDSHYHFATAGPKAEPEREEWLNAFREGIREVTFSLFPTYTMDVRPLPGVPATFTRIMAGYLIRCETADSLSLLYSELHAYFGGEAQLTLYKDEWCDHKVFTVRLTGEMDLHSCTGVDCSMFALDGHLFAARTQDERELWLRAAGNIKVKLMFEAPNPTSQELIAFRSSVLERILQIKGNSLEAKARAPLLPMKPRAPVKGPLGDEIADVADDCASRNASRVFSRRVSPPPRISSGKGSPRASIESSQTGRALPDECAPEDEEFVCRVARVVELMDDVEFRQLLAPFDSSHADSNV